MITPEDVQALHRDELAAVANAVSRRRHEFATGRSLLRDLLATANPIPVGPTRAPTLPQGWVGSLAHDRSVAIAAVCRETAYAALGIDVEPDDPLPSDMARIILRDDEFDLDAHLAFVLKEATYKVWSNAGGRMLEHHEVFLHVDRSIEGPRFRATVLPERRTLEGRFATVAGKHIALVSIAAA